MATPSVPNIGTVAGKWRRRVEAAPDDYAEGIRTKGARWQPAAAAASGNYRTAVSAAGIEDRFKAGVARSAAKYARRASELGAPRFAQAAPIAELEYSARFGPFLQAIAAVDLPARGPRGSGGNYARVKPIGDALSKLRLSGR